MTFQLGLSGNPAGRSVQLFQDYTKRTAHLMEKYTPEQLVALASNLPKLSRECSTFDGLIVVNLANAFKYDGKERERLLDRLLGKSVQRIGGETPGEPIKLHQPALDIENMPRELRDELAAVLKKALVATAESQAGRNDGKPS
jgi:hypothetical protein